VTYDFSDDWLSHKIPLFEEFPGDRKSWRYRLPEIVSFEGRSVIWLNANIATHSSSLVEAIDVYKHAMLRPNLAASSSSKIIVFRSGTSAAMMRTLPFDACDFAYVDGCHSKLNWSNTQFLPYSSSKRGGVRRSRIIRRRVRTFSIPTGGPAERGHRLRENRAVPPG
jgi:hypothetical protein